MDDEIKNNEMKDEQGSNITQRAKIWIQDNIRIIVSVLLVCLIAFSVYSYSKRGENKNSLSEKNNEVEEILKDLSPEKDQAAEITDESASDADNKNNNEDSANNNDTVAKDSEKEESNNQDVQQKNNSNQKNNNLDTEKNKSSEKPISGSKETETSFVESASSGDSITVLARKALAHYLEKNPDSTLTPEHKIYIEDYLRKNVRFSGRIYVGTSVEFSKDLIKNAIDTSKKLTDSQLNNLHKYAVRVQF